VLSHVYITALVSVCQSSTTLLILITCFGSVIINHIHNHLGKPARPMHTLSTARSAIKSYRKMYGVRGFENKKIMEQVSPKGRGYSVFLIALISLREDFSGPVRGRRWLFGGPLT
jgi:hypothetical protein